MAEIRQALLTHKVIFFRGQDLDHAAQIAFARQFGDLTHAHPHEDAPPQDAPEILTIDPRRYEKRYGTSYTERIASRQYSYFAGWHTDVTAAVNPPAASILRAQTVPEFGGDTTWTNLVAAYEGLSEPLRRFADGLTAQHCFLAGYKQSAADSLLAQRVSANLLVSNHPVVRVHPETGERALFVNPGFTDHILGSSAVESRRILDLLYEQIALAGLHGAVPLGAGQRRDLGQPGYRAPRPDRPRSSRRGARAAPRDADRYPPVGPTGFTSETVEGKPFLSDADVKVA